jgi:excisionase family DNA binding protein
MSAIVLTGDELADMIRRLTASDGWMTVKEAAAWARVARATVADWISRGKLPSYAPGGGKRLVRRSDVDRLIRRSHVLPGECTVHDEALAKGRAALAAKRAAAKAAESEGRGWDGDEAVAAEA